jgi:GNAT superfamily N-acetyltransferase
LLGEISSRIIGYVKMNKGKSELGIVAKNPIELERIYLVKDFHRKGIGLQLMNESIRLAKSLEHDKLWLGVWEK